jgi:basic membrane lipoprotein Med (substrate-binding protein (PBP1-ABC) superfamily)
MKRVTLPLLLLFFMVACDKTGDIEPFAPAFEVYALFPPSGFGDRSYMDLVYEGIETAASDQEFTINYIIPESTGAGMEWIAGIPGLKPDHGESALIIVAGREYSPSVDSLNGSFGRHKVFLLDGGLRPQEGLATHSYRSYAPSYLAGYLSASLVKNCRAVMIGPFDAPFLSENQLGFRQGVEDAGGSVSPTVYLSSGFEGFDMIDSAYRTSQALAGSHDLIFALASGSNIGVIDALRNYPEKRYVVGIDADQSWMGLKVVTGSVVSRIDEDIREGISSFAAGSFVSGHFVRSMEDGRSDFIINTRVLGTAPVPQSLIDTAIRKEKGLFPGN